MLKDNHLIVDNYELDVFRGCPRKYYYSIILSRSPLGQSITPLQFGIAYHLALELHSKGRPIQECIQAALDYFRPHETLEDDKRTCGKLRDLLLYYFDYYAKSNMHPIKDMNEIGFAVELSPTIIYSGRIDDFWTVDDYPGLIFPMDTKTASMVGLYIVKPNAQFTGYIYGASTYYENIGGLVCNLIGVYKNKPCPRKDGNGWLKDSAPSDVFFRVITQRSKEELEDWKLDTIHYCEDILKCLDKGRWPQRTLNCSAYNKQCDYIGVCNLPSSEMREEMIMSTLFEERVWEPYPTTL